MRARRLRCAWLLLLLVPLLLVGGFVAWAETAPPPMPEAVAALASDEDVEVATSPWLIFRPKGSQPRTGLVLYPGGRVDPRAYAPGAHALARRGYLVVIVPMPLNLAFFRPSAADQVIGAFPEVTRWAARWQPALRTGLLARQLASCCGPPIPPKVMTSRTETSQ